MYVEDTGACFHRRRVLHFGYTVPGIGEVTGSISGSIDDSSGAAVPGAIVTVTHLETEAARTLVTVQTGSYRTLSLPVGPYEVKAEKPGFKTGIRTGIDLVVAREAAVNVTLQLGIPSNR